MPDTVTVYEVGPRDGLQNEAQALPAATKMRLIQRLAATGLKTVEATSFVHPKWVPQLADAADVVAGVDELLKTTRLPVLVPNEAGLERALAANVRDVAVFGSVTESFSQRNLNRSVEEALAMFAPVVSRARDAGLGVRGYLSMAFGDPWEGAVEPARVLEVVRRMRALGVEEISLGDTIGVATPGDVVRVVEPVLEELPIDAVALHFHDTYGQALANVLAALGLGVRSFDSSVGGLGGCPFAQSATGNLATEDLVFMLNGMGIETGVDLAALVDVAWWISGELGREPTGRAARALGHAGI